MAELRTYRRKRDFAKTPEPQGGGDGRPGLYCIQKHAARQLHYDLRLELDGVLVSWAVPKGPSLDPKNKRLAVHVEDHPVEYGGFEGTIPKGEYGGGTVMLWDTGTWVPAGDPRKGLEKGELKFRVEGERLRGSWVLVHTGGRRGREDNEWLLIKERDEEARSGGPDPWDADDRSVSTGRSMDEIAGGEEPRRRSGRGTAEAAGTPRGRKSTAARVPDSVPLSLATLVESPPEGDGWVHEIKYDGYRIAARAGGGDARLFSRNGLDWTERFPEVAAALRTLPASGTWLDGEVVVFDERGVSDFGRLQRHLKDGRAGDLTYVVFDLLFQDGEDLRELPLSERKRRLRWLLGRGGKQLREVVRYGDHIDGQGAAVYEEACLQELEGVVSKRAADKYAGRRTRSWLKSKCARSQEFVIGGFTEPAGSRAGFGALLVGVYDEEGALRYAGRVGTGFDDRALTRLRKRLAALERTAAPFADAPRGAQARGVHWTAPELVAEVRFSEWTGDGRLRHPVFQGLREDKGAAEVRREREARAERAGDPAAPPAPAAQPEPAAKPERAAKPDTPRRPGKPVVGGVAISHPDRVVFPDPGLTKLDVAEYYAAVAGLMVPYLERPCAHRDPLPGRHRLRVLLPEARDAVRPQDRRQGPRARQPRSRHRLPRGRHCRGPARDGAERRRGVPRLGLEDRGHRDAGHPGVRPRPGARPRVAQGERGRAGAARRACRPRPPELRAHVWRQGAARGGAALLRHGLGAGGRLRARGRRDPGRAPARQVHGDDEQGKAGRQGVPGPLP